MNVSVPAAVGALQSSRVRSLLVPLVRLSAILGQFAYVKTYSHLLSNYQLGIYFYLMTSSYFLNALVFVPVDYYQQSRVYPFRDAGISLSAFLRFNRTLLLLIGAVAALVVLPCLWAGRIVALEVALCAAMAVTLYVTTAFKNLLNNLNHKLTVSVLFLAEAVLKTGFFYAAERILPAQATVLVASNVLALLVILVLLVWVARRRRIFWGGSAHHVNYREVAGFSLPLALGAIANWVQSQGYRLVLVPLGYTETVGVYATVANLGITGMNALSTVFGQIYAPKIYQTQGAYLGTYLRNALALTVLALGGGFLVAHTLVPLLTRGDLARYSPLVLFGIGTEAGNFLVGALAIYLTIKNRTRAIMQSSFVGLLVVVLAVGAICLLHHATVYTIGIPIVLSQAAVALYLIAVWHKLAKSDRKQGN